MSALNTDIPRDITRARLMQQYRDVRAQSEALCRPLQVDDYQIQSITETSPPKWHLAHVSWFFETFVLPDFKPDFEPWHPAFAYLFNSYYETVGSMQPRPRRGLLSRPTVQQVYQYRQAVDEQMLSLMETASDAQWQTLAFRIRLGLQHEQQHQELLLMDIKHNFFSQPLLPAYRDDLRQAPVQGTHSLQWHEHVGGQIHIGHAGDGFAFDNETPRHAQLVSPHQLANRLVTNGEYLAFIEDQGYQRSDLWLSDGWHHIRQQQWLHPLYWQQQEDGSWCQFTLGGLVPLDLDAPVCHVSFYEADAFARWAGKRLPTEAELETRLSDIENSSAISGNFVEQDMLTPVASQSAQGQWFGDVWEWTATPYAPYPGFQPLAGSMGEYNGKFMCNQMVLKGGCCLTPQNHIRASYRNFFYPHDRWACSGIRLAADI